MHFSLKLHQNPLFITDVGHLLGSISPQCCVNTRITGNKIMQYKREKCHAKPCNYVIFMVNILFGLGMYVGNLFHL